MSLPTVYQNEGSFFIFYFTYILTYSLGGIHGLRPSQHSSTSLLLFSSFTYISVLSLCSNLFFFDILNSSDTGNSIRYKFITRVLLSYNPVILSWGVGLSGESHRQDVCLQKAGKNPCKEEEKRGHGSQWERDTTGTGQSLCGETAVLFKYLHHFLICQFFYIFKLVFVHCDGFHIALFIFFLNQYVC